MSWPEVGGNWEGSFRDHHGCRWIHHPNQGWRVEHNHRPYLRPAAQTWWVRCRRRISLALNLG